MDDEKFPIIIIGAGGAGLLAAWAAASAGAPVLLLERNRKAGIKLLISGGGKCNITHAGPVEEVRSAFPLRQARFLRHAFHALSNDDVRSMLEAEGVGTFARENGRVFPASGRADDVVEALLRRAQRAGAALRLNARVGEVLADREGVCGVRVGDERLASRHVLIATGGVSYPKTGTTGDGFAWTRTLGHTVLPLRPALAPVAVAPPLPPSWRGVAVRGGRLAVYAGTEKTAHFDGDILFTHEGVSGPAALEVSAAAALAAGKGPAELRLDFFPAMEFPALEELLRQRVEAQRGKMLATLLNELLPNRMVEGLLAQAGVPGDVRGHVLTAAQRRATVRLLKAWTIGRVAAVHIERGEVTAGGVLLDEVDPHSMRSRKVGGLYLAGELLDINGPVGGYNLQAAFSTGAVAGAAAAADWKNRHPG